MSNSFPPLSTRSTTGKDVCDWIQTFCRLGEGDQYGEPLVLRPFQVAFIHSLYELNEDGSRHYSRAVLGIPKGAGKTQLAAAIAAYELCGDVHVAPLVAVCASSFEQADLLFGDLKQICRQSPDLAAITDVFDTEILLKNQPGRAYRVAAVAGANDGARPTAAIFDEVHELTGNKARVHLVLSNGTAKRKDAFTLSISTAGYDPESLLGQLYQHGLEVNNGEVDDPGFLFTWYEADEHAPLTTREEWRAAIESCNPATTGGFLNVESVVSRCMEMPLFEAKRYQLNVWTENETQWEVAGLWPGLQSDLEPDPGLPLFVGLDVGVVHDSTAVVWCQKIEEKYVLRAKVWENPHPLGSPAHARWRFELEEVEAFCRELKHDFPRPAVRDERGRYLPGPAFIYDPNRFVRSAQLLVADGLNMVEFPQHESRLIPMSQVFFDLCKEGLIAHDGNPDLARHVRNVVASQKSRGWRIDKPHGSHKNIDGALAAAMAVLQASHAGPAAPEPRIRVIEAGIDF